MRPDKSGLAIARRRLSSPRAACERLRHRIGAANLRIGAYRGRRGVGPADHVGIQQLEQAFEVAAARRREERVDDRPLAREIGLRLGTAHAPARAARELSRRRRRPADDRRDLFERHGEHVVQDEGKPLGRIKRVEHDEQRQAN